MSSHQQQPADANANALRLHQQAVDMNVARMKEQEAVNKLAAAERDLNEFEVKHMGKTRTDKIMRAREWETQSVTSAQKDLVKAKNHISALEKAHHKVNEAHRQANRPPVPLFSQTGESRGPHGTN